MGKKTTFSENALRSQRHVRTIRTTAYRSGETEQSANTSREVNLPLGEVRVKVNLTNAGDEVLVRRGFLTADKIRSYEANALVDSGAVRSVLPRHVVQLLGLPIVGRTRATYANDATEDIDIAEVVGIDIGGRRTTEETLVLGSEVLIGQTVLESLDLLVDCTNHRVIPNPAHPDQPVIKIKHLLRSTVPSVAGLQRAKKSRRDVGHTLTP
jgi:clan AA aspartic protease